MFKMNFDGIGKLVIYGDGKILLEKTRDLNNVMLTEGKTEFTQGRIEFYLSDTPKNARKENLNRKDCYFLNYTDTHNGYYNERKTALYVHESEISVTNLGEYVSMNSNGETCYLYRYALNFKNGFEYNEVNSEKMLVDGKWTLPSGAKWHTMGDYNNTYDVISKDQSEFYKKRHPDSPEYNLVHWTIERKTASTNYYSSETYHRIEKTEDRKEREKLADILNSALGSSSHLSHYDIEELLKVVDIKIKANA